MKRVATSERVGVWYAVIPDLGSLGAVLTYRGPLSSDAWRHWSSPGACMAAAVTAYVLQSIHGTGSWVEIFVPTAVSRFIQNL
jgi:hypothetical protein